MTFSIVARDGDAWGVAVAGTFLAAGSVVLETGDGREHRRLGVVGVDAAVTYTGSDCPPWAGGRTGGDGTTAYAIQGKTRCSPHSAEVAPAPRWRRTSRSCDARGQVAR